jgi:hypothetical protein
MYLHIAGPRPDGVEKAKELCEELLKKVRADYQDFKENAQQGRFGGGGDRYYDGRSGGYEGRPGYGDGERSQSYGQGGYGGHGAPNDLQSPAAASDTDAQAAAWAAWYAQQGQQPGADPYAAYGGYEAYVQYCQWWYAQPGMQQSSAPGTAVAPPPPPPAESGPPGGAPPPPPPSGSPPGTYTAVRELSLTRLLYANDRQGPSASRHVSIAARRLPRCKPNKASIAALYS